MTQPAFDFGDEGWTTPPTRRSPSASWPTPSTRRCARSFSDGVWVRGEIQGWSERGGHAYFTLADDSPGRQAVVRVQFFAPARQRLRPLLAKHRLRLSDGMKVRIFGHLDFYGPAGQLGLKMTDLDPRFTLGDLAAQRDQVLRRLAADGSLDANRSSPAEPGAAAGRGGHAAPGRRPGTTSTTSSSAAARVPPRARRHQGAGARGGPARRQGHAGAVGAATHGAGDGGLDVIVVIRGGGSRNELATFDAEPIARAIAAAPVPVLTGLGHEIDRSVADEVAHTSLKTPTACAAALVQAVAAYLAAVEERFAGVVEVAARPSAIR